MPKQLLYVFIGGGLGSVFRYLISKFLNTSNAILPWGTLTVNILGSIILGFTLGFIIKQDQTSSAINFLIAVGFCGGFTTFSTFAFENEALLRSGDYFHFSIYALGSLILGILGIALGFFLSNL